MAYKQLPGHSVDELKALYFQKARGLGMRQDIEQPILDFILEETRAAWFRGKEVGWKRAFTWKQKKVEQATAS